MQRRQLLGLLGGAAFGPVGALAQQQERMRRIGVLTTFDEKDAYVQSLQAIFRKRLGEAGWQVGRNIHLAYRWTADSADRLDTSAKELIEQQPNLVFTQTTPATAAALRQTHTIPIVFVLVADPVGSGFVSSLNRPAGNVTGFMNMEPIMAGKWVELLKEIAPQVSRVSLLFNPTTAPYSQIYVDPFKAAASALGVEPILVPVQRISDFDAMVADEVRRPGGGVIVAPDQFLVVHRIELISTVARYRLPTIYPQQEFAKGGGLLSYGNDRADQFPLAAIYADRILKGEKPADLPVQAPTKYELVINLKTARALGLEVPPMLLARADEVIE